MFLRTEPRKTEISIILFTRRKHKKGVEEDVAKKRTRRTQKFQRAVVGASLNVSVHRKLFY